MKQKTKNVDISLTHFCVDFTRQCHGYFTEYGEMNKTQEDETLLINELYSAVVIC